MNMTEMNELQALREEVRDLKARHNFAVEIISEIIMSNPGADVVELADYALLALLGFGGKNENDRKD